MGITTAALGLLAAGAAAPSAAEAPDRTGSSASGTGKVELVSFNTDPTVQADGGSISGTTSVASAGGGAVVYWTTDALVPQDTNGLADVYLRSLDDDVTLLVSAAPDGAAGNGDSHEPSISENGQFVAFTTTATNLVARDTNGPVLDVVVKDLRTGKTVVVSRTSGGKQKRQNSLSPVLSADGSAVAFQTFASFARSDKDKREDIYVHTVRSGKTIQASVNSRGQDLPAHYAVGSITNNGSKVSFGDHKNAWVRDLKAKKSTRVWHEGNHPSQPGPGGTVGRPMISGNGKFLVFSTRSTKPVTNDKGALDDVFRVDLKTRRAIKVSVGARGKAGNGESYLPSISSSGRYVAFVSDASNLVAGDRNGSPDVFWRDIDKRRTLVASFGADGTANSWSGRSGTAITGDGGHVVFRSYATDLVAGDDNEAPDIFRWSLNPRQ